MLNRVTATKRGRYTKIVWTMAMDQELVCLWSDHSTSDIGRVMGLTESQVTARVYKLRRSGSKDFPRKTAGRLPGSIGRVDALPGRWQQYVTDVRQPSKQDWDDDWCIEPPSLARMMAGR